MNPAPRRSLLSGIAILATLAIQAAADVSLPVIFGDHAVLQRNVSVPVWGWADPGERVRVVLDHEPPLETVAGPDGAWRVALPPHRAGGPHTLTVSGKNTLQRSDLLFGEVWLCSGQSNMAFLVRSAQDFDRERRNADYPAIRHITVPRKMAPLPTKDIPPCQWKICSPETVGGFSAVAYFFGRDLYKALDHVPVGLINSSWGGTRIEPWTPLCGFRAVPSLAGIVKKIELKLPDNPEHRRRLAGYLDSLQAWIAQARTLLKKNAPTPLPPPYPDAIKPFANHQDPTVLYNRMIHGLVPYAIRGFLWYQGESNHYDGMLYYDKTKALLHGWRTVWNQPDLPFYFTQIAPYQYGSEAPGILPEFWMAQEKAATLPHTGMALTIDVGDIHNIHPKNKQAVGKRLALLALARTYHKPGIIDSGPTFRSMTIEGSQIRVRFDHADSGLVTRDGKPPTDFEIYDRNGEEFIPAQARIDGDSVLLSSPKAPHPVAVRFAWSKIAEPNLANKAGLPAAPFRAGKVPHVDYLAKHVPEAKNLTLVYDLDLARLGANPRYTVDRHTKIHGKIDRIAYFLELKQRGRKTRYIYVAMDPFTQDLGKIAVPTVASKAHFQTRVHNLTVITNAPGIVAGTGLEGNIEFWPNNYGPPNSAHVPNASSALWDFGDEPSNPVDGYGCMQVHNFAARQTLFAVNCWKAGPRADIGIGNSPPRPVLGHGNKHTARTRDWTFQANAGAYVYKRLRVFVHLAK